VNGFLAHLVMRALDSPATLRPIVANPFEPEVPAAPEDSASSLWSARAGEDVSVAQAATTISGAVPSTRLLVENDGSNLLPAPTSRHDRVRAATPSEVQTGAREKRAADAVTPSERRNARDVARASISKSVRESVDDIEQPLVGPSRGQGAPRSDSFVKAPKDDAAPSQATVTVPSRSAKSVDTQATPPPSREASSVRAGESVTRLDTRPAKSSSVETAAPRLQPILPPALRPAQSIPAQRASGIAASHDHGEGPRPVQVTIGRVEIRAVTPALRPQSPARVQRKPTLSLADYLSRENGARR
jgi:hypothetical protein